MSYGRCNHNCTNQTRSGYCKTTVCIHPIYSQKHYPVIELETQKSGAVGEIRYSVSLEELRQSIRNVCDTLYSDESTSNFMYVKLLELIQMEIISRCNLIK